VQLVAAQPEKSDRQLAKETGTTHPTIAKAREQAEATGKALPVEKRTGGDGKTRKQPKRSAKANGKDQQVRPTATGGNGADPEASAAARKQLYGTDEPQPATKPTGKREAKRQEEWQRKEAMRAEGEAAAKELISRHPDMARELHTILSDPDSADAFTEALALGFDAELKAAAIETDDPGTAAADRWSES
jgi:hypothetical protein